MADDSHRSALLRTERPVYSFLYLCSLFLLAADISEIESYRSYSPEEDRGAAHSDISSHSSNEKLREKPRYREMPPRPPPFVPEMLSISDHCWRSGEDQTVKGYLR